VDVNDDCFICFEEKLCDGHKAIPVASFDEELCDGREVITVANERRVRVDPDGGAFGGRDNHGRMQGEQPSVRELAVGEDDEAVRVRGVSERASAHVASDAWQ